VSQNPGQSESLVRRAERTVNSVHHRYRDVVNCNPGRTWWQKKQLLETPQLTPRQRELLRAVSSRIIGHDAMYKGDGAHYFSVGMSAIECVDEALESAGQREVRNILDLPCGNGRVLRFLEARFPEASVTACDLEREAVDFCHRTFGARRLYSRIDLENLDPGEDFDLIWCGSLMTHLPADTIVGLLRFFNRCLRPGGVAVFSTHGENIVDVLGRKGPGHYGLAEEQARLLVAAWEKDGYGFAEYPRRRPGYGFSLISPEWIGARIAEIPGCSQVYFAPKKWDGHHDVYGIRKDA
jgi:SAM-dependent methyltransferase